MKGGFAEYPACEGSLWVRIAQRIQPQGGREGVMLATNSFRTDNIEQVTREGLSLYLP